MLHGKAPDTRSLHSFFLSTHMTQTLPSPVRAIVPGGQCPHGILPYRREVEKPLVNSVCGLTRAFFLSFFRGGLQFAAALHSVCTRISRGSVSGFTMQGCRLARLFRRKKGQEHVCFRMGKTVSGCESDDVEAAVRGGEELSFLGNGGEASVSVLGGYDACLVSVGLLRALSFPSMSCAYSFAVTNSGKCRVCGACVVRSGLTSSTTASCSHRPTSPTAFQLRTRTWK